MRGFQDRQVVCWRCSTSATSRSRPSIPQHQLLAQGAQGVRLPGARLAEDQHVLAAVEERPVAQAPHLTSFGTRVHWRRGRSKRERRAGSDA